MGTCPSCGGSNYDALCDECSDEMLAGMKEGTLQRISDLEAQIEQKFDIHPMTCGHCGAEVNSALCQQCGYEEKSISTKLSECTTKLATAKELLEKVLSNAVPWKNLPRYNVILMPEWVKQAKEICVEL